VTLRWDVITIGNLSRNCYWGEGDDVPVRPVLCTSTLIRGKGFRLLADPPIADQGRMGEELDRRTGLGVAEIDAVFISHGHGDHHAGLRNFPEARWIASPGVAAEINASGEYEKALEGAEGRIFDTIDVISTPGHTLDHHSLLFEADGLRVVVAADAVMTRDFWNDRRGFFNSADFELAARTMADLSTRADIIVPGHDNYFLNEHPRSLHRSGQGQ
jgi:glyoxylase-like metal-dependent hydrolase (beta-lactamase superfamily II)